MLLNSLMSILSFNHFDFALIFGKVEEGDKQGRMHRSKFWRQLVFNVIIVVTNLGYKRAFVILSIQLFQG